WRLGTIFSLKSGQPFTVNLSGNRSRDVVANNGADRPNVNPGRNPGNITSGVSSGCSHLDPVKGVVVDIAPGTPIGTPDLYFDPCAFSLQPAGLLGNAGRNFLFGPGLRNLDFSLTKVTHLPRMGEAGQLEFRFETFNMLNHRNLYIPSGRSV